MEPVYSNCNFDMKAAIAPLLSANQIAELSEVVEQLLYEEMKKNCGIMDCIVLFLFLAVLQVQEDF